MSEHRDTGDKLYQIGKLAFLRLEMVRNQEKESGAGPEFFVLVYKRLVHNQHFLFAMVVYARRRVHRSQEKEPKPS